MCRLSWNLGVATSWNPQGLSRPVIGLLFLVLYLRFRIAHRVLVCVSIGLSVYSIISYTSLPPVLQPLVSSVYFSILLSLPLTPLFRPLLPIGHSCHPWLVPFSPFSYTDFFLEYDAVSVCNRVPTFRLNIIALSSKVQMSNRTECEYFDSWRWGNYVVSKRRVAIVHWRNVIFQNNALRCLDTSGSDCLLAQRRIPEECIT